MDKSETKVQYQSDMSSVSQTVSIVKGASSPLPESGCARGGNSCGKIWFDADFWFGAFAIAAAAGAFFLNQAITMVGMKKRRSSLPIILSEDPELLQSMST